MWRLIIIRILNTLTKQHLRPYLQPNWRWKDWNYKLRPDTGGIDVRNPIGTRLEPIQHTLRHPECTRVRTPTVHRQLGVQRGAPVLESAHVGCKDIPRVGVQLWHAHAFGKQVRERQGTGFHCSCVTRRRNQTSQLWRNVPLVC